MCPGIAEEFCNWIFYLESPEFVLEFYTDCWKISMKLKYISEPLSNYASVPANNNPKSRLVLSYARICNKCIAQHSTSLDFRLLFAGTEA